MEDDNVTASIIGSARPKCRWIDGSFIYVRFFIVSTSFSIAVERRVNHPYKTHVKGHKKNIILQVNQTFVLRFLNTLPGLSNPHLLVKMFSTFATRPPHCPLFGCPHRRWVTHSKSWHHVSMHHWLCLMLRLYGPPIQLRRQFVLFGRNWYSSLGCRSLLILPAAPFSLVVGWVPPQVTVVSASGDSRRQLVLLSIFSSSIHPLL